MRTMSKNVKKACFLAEEIKRQIKNRKRAMLGKGMFNKHTLKHLSISFNVEEMVNNYLFTPRESK